MEVTIAKTNDAQLLAQLNEEVQALQHNLYPEEFKPYNAVEVAKAFESILENPNARAFVANYNTTVVGYWLGFVASRKESAFQNPKSILVVDQVLVLKKYRKQGIAKKLLVHTKSFAKENDIKQLELEYWEGNTTARDFFTQNGFAPLKHKMQLKN